MIGAYTVSREQVDWHIENVPHINLLEPSITANVYDNPYEYIRQLAEKRNIAVKILLEKHPETRHVLCCDSAYVEQVEPLKRLIYDYGETRLLGNPIIGGAIWGRQRMRVRDFIDRKMRWTDWWSVPELLHAKRDNGYEYGLQPVKTMSAVHIFPRTAWDNGTRYGAYPDYGCTETGYFSQHSGLPCFIDFAARFRRDRIYSVAKCFHCSIGLRSRLGLGR